MSQSQDFGNGFYFSMKLAPASYREYFPDVNIFDYLSTILHLTYLKDTHTYRHSVRVAELTYRISRECGFNGRNLAEVLLAAYLHDIGKIIIADRILKKSSSLTAPEYEIMKGHVSYGAQIVSGIRSLKRVREIISHHHENYNGTGYPAGIRGAEIDMGARIISLADNYEAMTSDRIYRKRISNGDVLTWMEEREGTNFDPEFFQVFKGIVLDGFEYSTISHIPFDI